MNDNLKNYLDQQVEEIKNFVSEILNERKMNGNRTTKIVDSLKNKGKKMSVFKKIRSAIGKSQREKSYLKSYQNYMETTIDLKVKKCLLAELECQ